MASKTRKIVALSDSETDNLAPQATKIFKKKPTKRQKIDSTHKEIPNHSRNAAKYLPSTGNTELNSFGCNHVKYPRKSQDAVKKDAEEQRARNAQSLFSHFSEDLEPLQIILPKEPTSVKENKRKSIAAKTSILPFAHAFLQSDDETPDESDDDFIQPFGREKRKNLSVNHKVKVKNEASKDKAVGALSFHVPAKLAILNSRNLVLSDSSVHSLSSFREGLTNMFEVDQEPDLCPIDRYCDAKVKLPMSVRLKKLFDDYLHFKTLVSGGQLAPDVLHTKRVEFCRLHRNEITIIPEGIKKGYLCEPDFTAIPSKIRDLHLNIENLISGGYNSVFLKRLLGRQGIVRVNNRKTDIERLA